MTKKLSSVALFTYMCMRKLGRASSFAVTLVVLLLYSSEPAHGQGVTPATPNSAAVARPEVNHEVQLYVLIASNTAGQKGDLPAALEGVTKQLKSSLPFVSYRLGSVLLNRVKDGGSLSVSGVGSSTLSGQNAAGQPAFYDLKLNRVKLEAEAGGGQYVQIPSFGYNLRLPVVAGGTRAEGGAAGYPVIQYQTLGLNTEVSIREGVPTLIGTLTTDKPDEAFILMLVVKRAGAH